MAILPVIKDPDPQLRQISLPVGEVNDELKEFMQSLLETMYEEGGIGIAAIQVGHPIRALIVDIPREEGLDDGEIIVHRDPVFIINPQIKYLSEETIILPEGCLSVRLEDGITFTRGDVMRPKSIGVKYTDLEGKSKELLIDGSKSDYDLWFSRCLQHEIDHLDGVLFTDKLVQSVFRKESL